MNWDNFLTKENPFSRILRGVFFTNTDICRMKSNGKTLIIGGGLSGLYLAYLLQKQNSDYTLLEASERLGGRIQTIKGPLDTPLELGATWFSEAHPQLLSLIEELSLEKYPQFSEGISLFQTKSFEPPQKFYVPESEAPSYRLRGGTGKLIERLFQELEEDRVVLNAGVTAIEEIGDNMKISTDDAGSFYADRVILCMPPELVTSKIQFLPALPAASWKLLESVQTWMAGSIKFTLEYERPFWRKNGYSGMLYSHSGIVTEMYDHTNQEKTRFGFTGFLNAGTASYSQEVRKDLVLRQLTELLGGEAASPTAYFDKVWKNEFIQENSAFIQRPHQNNGHALLQQAHMNGKLYFCGSETALQHGGYMEGAVMAARQVYTRL